MLPSSLARSAVGVDGGEWGVCVGRGDDPTTSFDEFPKIGVLCKYPKISWPLAQSSGCGVVVERGGNVGEAKNSIESTVVTSKIARRVLYLTDATSIRACTYSWDGNEPVLKDPMNNSTCYNVGIESCKIQTTHLTWEPNILDLPDQDLALTHGLHGMTKHPWYGST